MVVQLLCGVQDTFISFQENLSQQQPVALAISPSKGNSKVHIDIKEGNEFRAVCSHFHSDGEPFPVPRYINNLTEVPENCHFVLTHDDQGYTAYFCLSHHDIHCRLEASLEGGVYLHIANFGKEETKDPHHVLVCVRGLVVQSTISKTMQLAMDLTGGFGKIIEDKLPSPKWLGTLGWESGGAFGLDITHDSILNAVWSLRQSGFLPGFVLIEEGWQETYPSNGELHNMAMSSFDADKVKFPSGLKGLVDELHRAGVKHVGVWHGIMGYRGGIHAELAHRYDLPSDKEGRYFLGSDLGRTFQFFNDFYEYLRHQGIDFVQVGDQANVVSYQSESIDSTLLYKNLQSAMQASTSVHFNTSHFNDDCLCNENLFYWTIARIARAAESIDFVNPVGVIRGIRNNLSNSLWLQHIMQPDFDSWVTTDIHKETLAIFHALSGTINVIRDIPGEHDKNLIRKMVLPSGQVLVADKPLTLCQESIFFNPLESKQVYKAFTIVGLHGIVGAFNLTTGKRTLHGHISPLDVENLKGDTFAVFSCHNGFIGIIGKEGSIPITLKPNQSDILTLAPIQNGVAVIGCYSLYLAPGPILEISIEDNSVHITSIVAGPFIVYCEKQVLEIRRNGHVIPWEYDSKSCVLSIDSHSNVLDVHSVYSITFE